MGNKRIVYEDPAAALNVTERRWNQIVQENLVKFEAENAKKVTDKLDKNKRIWEEQKKQIEAKAIVNAQQKPKDQEFFHKVGAKSSDVYYINEDKKKAYNATLKGGAGKMAQ